MIKIKFKTRDIFYRAVIEGIDYGWNYYFIDNQKMEPSSLQEEIISHVLDAIEEVISVDAKNYTNFKEHISNGVTLGWNRAHKHTDNPKLDVLKEHLQDEIMNCLEEIVKF